MNRFLVCAALAGFGASSLIACNSDPHIRVVVIAPDGGDPFVGPDAATQARITLQNGSDASTTVPVGAGGAFQIDIQPHTTDEISRLEVLALRGETVIASGLTPLVRWSAASGLIPVLMQYRDTLVPAPVTLASGRADCDLVQIGSQFAGIFTYPAASTTAASPDIYDVLHHARAGRLEQSVQGEFDGDSTVVVVSENSQLTPVVFNRLEYLPYVNDASTSHLGQIADTGCTGASDPALSCRAQIVRSTGFSDASGSWLIGGRGASGAVTRVDGRPVTSQDAISAFVAARHALNFPRVKPQVISIVDSQAAPTWLVAGGNAASDPFLEVCSPGGGSNHGIALEGHERSDAAVVCTAMDNSGCSRALVVGGRAGSGLVTDSLVLDLAALRDGRTPVVVAVGPSLVHPRANPRAEFAEGGIVVVAGGDDDAGPRTDVEIIDVSASGAGVPPAGRVIDGSTCAHPATTALWNGTVMIAGGTHADGSACTDVAFFRH